MSEAFVCSYCAAVGVSVRVCSGCKATTYCSVACQKKDWPNHKLACGQAKAAPAAPAAEKAATPAAAPAAATPAPTTPAPEENQLVEKITDDAATATTANITQEAPQGSFITSPTFMIGAAVTALAAIGGAVYMYLGSSSPEQAPAAKPQPKGKRPQRR